MKVKTIKHKRCFVEKIIDEIKRLIDADTSLNMKTPD